VRTQLKAAQIADQIKHGGQKMPAFGDSLSQDEIMQLVSFLRAKHPRAKSPRVAVPATGNSLSNPAQQGRFSSATITLALNPLSVACG